MVRSSLSVVGFKRRRTSYCERVRHLSLLQSGELVETFACHLVFQCGGDRRVEAVLAAGLLLALSVDVFVALFGERRYLVANLLALGEASVNFLPALGGRELLQVVGQVVRLH